MKGLVDVQNQESPPGPEFPALTAATAGAQPQRNESPQPEAAMAVGGNEYVPIRGAQPSHSLRFQFVYQRRLSGQTGAAPLILVARVREIQVTSSNESELAGNVLAFIGASVLCTATLVFLLVIPVLMLVIGIVYVKDCPAEKNIPIYLIVGGVLMLVTLISDIYSTTKWRKEGYRRRPIADFLHVVFDFFTLGWFIAGCVWTFRVYVPEFDDKNSSNYCNKTLYYFAFTLVTTKLVMIVVFGCCLCCLVCIGLAASPDDHNRDQQ
ncbi:transmembrane protein 272-like isoform X2 [Ornithodoros turicata]|uniref:transmembrane protein 272-like isoform X2 n=1 Tax=Ornithodoros turicata TaxID=34597 RepID=UPI003138A1A7